MTEDRSAQTSKRLMQRDESRVSVRGKELGRYGVGIEVGKVGDREVVGHWGGYPGHITRTWIDPVDGIVVSALTNAVDGAAGQIANGVLQLIDLALAAADELAAAAAATAAPATAGTGGYPVPGVPDDALVGRFANLWGVSDGRLVQEPCGRIRHGRRAGTDRA